MAGILGDVQERDQRSFLCSFSVPRPLFLFCSSDDPWFSLSIFLSFPLSIGPRQVTPFCIFLSLFLSISFGTYIISVFVSCLLWYLYDILASRSRLLHFLLYLRNRKSLISRKWVIFCIFLQEYNHYVDIFHITGNISNVICIIE